VYSRLIIFSANLSEDSLDNSENLKNDRKFQMKMKSKNLTYTFFCS